MPKRLPQSDQAFALLYHARSATPFVSQGGEPCAIIPSTVDSCRVLTLRSADFRDWLTANYYSEYENAPSSLALRAVLRTLEARAQYSNSPAQKVDHRVSFEGDPFAPSRVFIDLANPSGDVLEITSQGWRLTNNLHHIFRQSPGMLPLPIPIAANSEQPIANGGPSLAALFHLSPIAQTRILFFLATALRATGPYPILVLRGTASSGKSILARALRTLIDPSAAPLRRLPPTDRELLHLAQNNWMLVFDHVHRIPIKICEALCAVSSGETIETTQPDYRDAALAEIARPIILVAPLDEAQAPFTPPRSLSSRTLTVDLAPIAAPRLEAAVWSDFENLRTPMLATLADAVSSALRNIRDVELPNVSRFPDCAAWVSAAAPVLDLEPASIIETISDPESMWLGADPLRDTLHALLRLQSTWAGDSATLLTQLRAIAPLATLPSTPKALGQALARLPGITVSRDGRILTICKVSQTLRTQPPTANSQ
jgi:putative DNA primase/helicase